MIWGLLGDLGGTFHFHDLSKIFFLGFFLVLLGLTGFAGVSVLIFLLCAPRNSAVEVLRHVPAVLVFSSFVSLGKNQLKVGSYGSEPRRKRAESA